jgi:hypothetical protein
MSEKPVYALSIKQPWAWLICRGFKDIENRSRKAFPSAWIDINTHYLVLPQRIFIHASKTKTGKQTGDAVDFMAERGLLSDELNEQLMKHFLYADTDGVFGAIIGEADITNWVDHSDSLWFVGKYGFVLANPVLYEKPIPCRGQLGFFRPDMDGTKCLK